MNSRSSVVGAVTLALCLAGAAVAGEAARRAKLNPAPAMAGAPGGVFAPTLPPPTLAAKPIDRAGERRARVQPGIPAGATEIPYIETPPEPALTDAEKRRGYLLFQRAAVEPVYPNTRPLADERLEALVAFATPGQWESVNLALYPVRELVNLKVRASALKSPAGEIPADRVDVRLATYWNVGYPSYTTVNTYRRTPELLERVTSHSSPARECQRYWLSIHVPDDAKPGLYLGTVTLWDDGFDQAVSIPLALRVLGFRLVSDPARHYSAYYRRITVDLPVLEPGAYVLRATIHDAQGRQRSQWRHPITALAGPLFCSPEDSTIRRGQP